MRAAGIAPADERLRIIAADVVAMTAQQWAEYVGHNWTAEQDRIQRRMMQVAREAIQSAPRNWDGAKDAFYANVRKDPDLLWELLAPYRAQASQFWLTQAAAELHAQNRAAVKSQSGGGQSGHGGRTWNAPANTQETGGQSNRGNQQLAAPRPSAAAGAAALANVTRLSLLDTFKVNGQPIGEVTSAEANAWAGSRERDARFVRLLTANLPPTEPIKKYRTADEANALYAQAEVGHAE